MFIRKLYVTDGCRAQMYEKFSLIFVAFNYVDVMSFPQHWEI